MASKGSTSGKAIYAADIDPLFFFARIEKGKDPDDCWLWTGPKHKQGYGWYTKGGTNQVAHRVSYALHNGKTPAGVVVRHVCNVEACVNPDHLVLGDQKDNVDDKVTHRLTAEDAARIRRERMAGATLKRLGADHGIGIVSVKRILANELLADESWDPSDLNGVRVTAANQKRYFEDSEVWSLRKLWSQGKIQPSTIQKRTGLASGTVSDMLRGRTYRHIPAVPNPKTGEVLSFDEQRNLRSGRTRKPMPKRAAVRKDAA